MRRCVEPGCDRVLVRSRRGLCGMHYLRWWKAQGRNVPRPTPEERFWAKVDKTATCWLWTANTGAKGYGQISVADRPVSAHRYAYELLVGPIPDGLQLDHLCCVKRCVNPGHLEPVTPSENTRRAYAARRAAA